MHGVHILQYLSGITRNENLNICDGIKGIVQQADSRDCSVAFNHL